MPASYLRRERQNHTLQPTALVNEAFLKLVEQRNVRWQNRAHFFGIAAQAMRRILVDHARTHGRVKRGGAAPQVTLDEAMIAAESRSIDLLALDEALERLTALDERQARVVELKFFGGLSVEEAAEVLNISPATIKREWSMAKAWLHAQLSAPPPVRTVGPLPNPMTRTTGPSSRRCFTRHSSEPGRIGRRFSHGSARNIQHFANNCALIASHSEASGFLEKPAFADVSFTSGIEPLESDDDLAGVLGIGDILDQTYRVEAELGHGGMGVVYRVQHKALSRTFAAKLIHSRFADDPVFLERFFREAEALGKLKHPHIVDVTDFGVDRDGTARPYLIMEYLGGETLQQRLRAGPLAVDAALPVVEAIAAAMDHAHEQGVLHLDLKPGNVLLVDGPDGPSSPKILDFGLAQFLSPDADKLSPSPAVQPIGTPAYMAPELLAGDRPQPSADVYSLGVLM